MCWSTATRKHKYRYTPASGSLHDLEVAVADELPFLPAITVGRAS